MKSPRTSPYHYPGTEVLINKEGIRTQDELDDFDRVLSSGRMMTLPAVIPITADGFRSINRHLMQDVYGWAGNYRSIPTARASGPFCKPEYIDRFMRECFERIKSEGYLRKLKPGDFARRAAAHINELNAIHPFLEGNGRTNRAFLQTLGRQAGHAIDLSRIDAHRWTMGTVEGHASQGDERTGDVIELAIAGPISKEEQIPTPLRILGRSISKGIAKEARTTKKDDNGPGSL